ncbi:MAG: cyclase family protein [Actinobacteria bacterium]|nr:cyclase family protein [Actinomycetota bacterium]
MASRPKYADLPNGSAWDLLDPAMGSLALLTPARVAAAAKLVQSGKRFPLDLMLDQPSPPLFGREPYRHDLFPYGIPNVFDDKLDNFYPQGSTQWDGFGHFGHPQLGMFGGRSGDDIMNRSLGVEAWAQTGIAGRGVLLDAARHLDIPGNEAFLITPDHLARVAEAQGVELHEGDVLCVRVGWLAHYRTLDQAGREEISRASQGEYDKFKMPGLGPGKALAEYLWDHGVAAIAVDNPAVESFVGVSLEGEPDMVHTAVLAMLGIPLGEFFDLDDLAEDCAADGRYEFLFTSKPLGIPGGVGSPPNAMAIK